MGHMTVEHASGDRFTVAIRDHVVTVDQPASLGGSNAGPTPTELFIAGIAGCAAFYARRFLSRRGLDHGLRMAAAYEMSEARPHRVTGVQLRLTTHEPIPDQLLPALHRAMAHCPVHTTLHDAPDIDIVVEPAEALAGR
jgi:putative redox protein